MTDPVKPGAIEATRADNYGTKRLRRALEDAMAPRTGMQAGMPKAMIEPSQLAHHLDQFDQQAAALASARRELQQEHQDRVEAHCSEERWRSAHEAKSLELKEAREALRDAEDHIFHHRHERAVEVIRATLSPTKAGTNGGT